MARKRFKVIQMDSFGSAVRALRDSAVMTRADLARAAYISPSHLRNIENGHRAPSVEHARELDRVLGAEGHLVALSQSSDGVRRREILRTIATIATPASIGLHALADALTAYPVLDAVPRSCDIEAAFVGAAAAQRYYQAAAYTRAATVLPTLVAGIDAAVIESASRDVYRAQARVYIAAAKLTVKLRDTAAWITADRAMTAARLADDPLLMSAATYQLACALLMLGRSDAAERIAYAGADRPGDTSPEGVSHQGALLLLSAVVAARRGDGAEAHDRLVRARALADGLGEHNHGFTAFGATNIQIHEVSVAVALDDASVAAATADRIDTSGLPAGLRSRRATVRIEGAWALAHAGHDPEAVVSLAEAERAAPLALRTSPTAHAVLRDLLARERRGATPALRGLCQRAGIIGG